MLFRGATFTVLMSIVIVFSRAKPWRATPTGMERGKMENATCGYVVWFKWEGGAPVENILVLQINDWRKLAR